MKVIDQKGIFQTSFTFVLSQDTGFIIDVKY